MTVLLALAYAAVAALLLNLGLASAWDPRVKAGVILVVSLLYGGTYLGIRSLEGWPTAEPTPEDFRLHWIAVDEPDKKNGAEGAIYFWLRELDEADRPVGEPRAHVLPFDEETAGAAREALEMLQDGKRLNGRITLGLIDPAEDELDDSPAPRDPAGQGQLTTAEERLLFEFREVPPPDLPPKPPL